jgi:hypothetical protein
MGQLHLHRHGNHIHHKHIQTLRHKNSIPHKQFLIKSANKPHLYPQRTVLIFRNLQTYISRLQQGIHRSDILYIFYALCHFLTQELCTCVRQHVAMPLYVMFRPEQKCVRGNIIKNNKLYCLISVCSCFIIILKFYIF